jgi:hypothetical protein
VVVGGSGKAMLLLQRLSPRLADLVMLGPGKAFAKQKTRKPDDGRDNLYEPMPGPGRVHGAFGGKAKSTSLYTEKLELHPGRQRALLVGAAAAGLMAARRAGR